MLTPSDDFGSDLLIHILETFKFEFDDEDYNGDVEDNELIIDGDSYIFERWCICRKTLFRFNEKPKNPFI
jgi:hypothetical protein